MSGFDCSPKRTDRNPGDFRLQPWLVWRVGSLPPWCSAGRFGRRRDSAPRAGCADVHPDQLARHVRPIDGLSEDEPQPPKVAPHPDAARTVFEKTSGHVTVRVCPPAPGRPPVLAAPHGKRAESRGCSRISVLPIGGVVRTPLSHGRASNPAIIVAGGYQCCPTGIPIRDSCAEPNHTRLNVARSDLTRSSPRRFYNITRVVHVKH